MSYVECSDEYWQPNLFLGTGWVCTADGHDVRVIFWICVVQMIFAGLNTVSAFFKKVCPGKKEEESPAKEEDPENGEKTVNETTFGTDGMTAVQTDATQKAQK